METFIHGTIIKLSQLSSLGLTEEMVYSVVIFLGILGCYMLIRPIITFLIALQSERLLSYLLSSLVCTSIFFIAVLFIGEVQITLYNLFKYTLQSLAVLGLLLFLVHVWNYIQKGRKKVQKKHII